MYSQLRDCVKWDETADYWNRSVLHGKENIILGSYLIYSSCVQGFGRKGILEHWMEHQR